MRFLVLFMCGTGIRIFEIEKKLENKKKKKEPRTNLRLTASSNPS